MDEEWQTPHGVLDYWQVHEVHRFKAKYGELLLRLSNDGIARIASQDVEIKEETTSIAIKR